MKRYGIIISDLFHDSMWCIRKIESRLFDVGIGNSQSLTDEYVIFVSKIIELP